MKGGANDGDRRTAVAVACRGGARTGGEAPPRVDVHQHIWTDGLCAALAERTDTPRLRRSGRVWILQLAGEPAFEMPPAESADQRTAVLDDLGLDVGIVALSAALGAEELPEHEARRLISAWDDDADALPERLPAWGSLPLRLPDPADVDAALDRGRVGITIPATALSGPAAVDHLGPVLERLAERDAPLFVHPGPSAPGTCASRAHELRRLAVDRVARLGALRPRAPSAPAHPLRGARGPRAAPLRTAARARAGGRRPSGLGDEHRSTRRPPTARARSGSSPS